MVQVEEPVIPPDRLADDQVETRLGRLVLEALVLTLLNRVENLLEHRAVGDLIRSHLARHAADAAQFADQHPSAVAHQFRVEVLVTAGDTLDRVNVHPALVGERSGPDERLTLARLNVGHLGNVAAELGQHRQAGFAQALTAHLQSEVRDDAGEIGIAAPFAQAVDRALNLHRPSDHAG